jgi:hypothetical protein
MLVLLEDLRPLRRVLEFGAGDYSTSYFLGLPELEVLVSVEDDPRWIERVSSSDPRHTITSRRRDPAGYELVLVDDGGGPGGPGRRAETIRFVLARRHPIVVIHDADEAKYVEVVESLGVPYVLDDSSFPPSLVIDPKELSHREDSSHRLARSPG